MSQSRWGNLFLTCRVCKFGVCPSKSVSVACQSLLFAMPAVKPVVHVFHAWLCLALSFINYTERDPHFLRVYFSAMFCEVCNSRLYLVGCMCVCVKATLTQHSLTWFIKQKSLWTVLYYPYLAQAVCNSLVFVWKLLAVGHWRSAEVQKHVGEVLQGSHSHSVSGINSNSAESNNKTRKLLIPPTTTTTPSLQVHGGRSWPWKARRSQEWAAQSPRQATTLRNPCKRESLGG